MGAGHALTECEWGQTMKADTHHATPPTAVRTTRRSFGRWPGDTQARRTSTLAPRLRSVAEFKRDHPEECLTGVDKESRKLAEEE